MERGKCGICANVFHGSLKRSLRSDAHITPTIKLILSHVLFCTYGLFKFIIPLVLAPHFPLRYGNTTLFKYFICCVAFTTPIYPTAVSCFAPPSRACMMLSPIGCLIQSHNLSLLQKINSLCL